MLGSASERATGGVQSGQSRVRSFNPVLLAHVVGHVKWERAKGQTQVLEAEPRMVSVAGLVLTQSLCKTDSAGSGILI